MVRRICRETLSKVSQKDLNGYRDMAMKLGASDVKIVTGASKVYSPEMQLVWNQC